MVPRTAKATRTAKTAPDDDDVDGAVGADGAADAMTPAIRTARTPGQTTVATREMKTRPR